MKCLHAYVSDQIHSERGRSVLGLIPCRVKSKTEIFDTCCFPR